MNFSRNLSFQCLWRFNLVIVDTCFVSDKALTFDCDLDLGRGNIILCANHLLILLYQNRTEHTFIISQVKYMTYELTTKEYNKEAWKTYVNHTPPGVFTKCPVLPNIGNHWRHFLWLQAQPLHSARWIMVISISTVGVHLSLGISWWGLKLETENSKLDNLT